MKRWIIWGLIILVIGGLAFLQYRKKTHIEITYEEIPVVRGDLVVTVLATGTVGPENRLDIKPPVAGRVEEVVVLEGSRVKKGQVLAWMSSTERAALIDAARSIGPAEVKKWEENYKRTPILAPIDGTIIVRNVNSGQTFAGTDVLYTMSDRLTVKAQVDETDLAMIKLKQAANIVLDAYPKKIIEGEVDLINFDATTVNNVTTYIVDVVPKQTPEFMRSGMTANISFLVASRNGVLNIPNAALRVQDSQYSVLVRGSDAKNTQEKPVTIGVSDGKKTEIISGLVEGDVILLAQLPAVDDKSSKGTNPFSPFAPRKGGH